MESSSKRIAAVFVFVFLLAGAWIANSAISNKRDVAERKLALEASTLEASAPAATPNKQQDPVATVAPAPKLPPLPADSKEAIDSELQGIESALEASDASLSGDAPDGELGL